MTPPRRFAALLLGAGLLLAGCSPSPFADEDRYTGPRLPPREPTHDGTWRKGPADPVQHKAYPFDINTHCGIKWVRFGGRWWVLDTVYPGAPQVQGVRPDEHSAGAHGYMTLIGPDTANYDAVGMPTLQFVPSEKDPPGCA